MKLGNNSVNNKRIDGTDGCSPKSCNNWMCSMVKEWFFYVSLMQLQEILQNAMSCLKWHHFTVGSVRVVPYKDVVKSLQNVTYLLYNWIRCVIVPPLKQNISKISSTRDFSFFNKRSEKNWTSLLFVRSQILFMNHSTHLISINYR